MGWVKFRYVPLYKAVYSGSTWIFTNHIRNHCVFGLGVGMDELGLDGGEDFILMCAVCMSCAIDQIWVKFLLILLKTLIYSEPMKLTAVEIS